MFAVLDNHDLQDWDAPNRIYMSPIVGPFDTYDEAITAAIHRWENRYDDDYQIGHMGNGGGKTCNIVASPVADDRELWILPMETS
jgi:hypothetical protein